MAAQYTSTAITDVAVNQNVLFDNYYPCNKGNIIHTPGSGIFTVRGATQQKCAKYRITFTGNITGTGGQLMLALTQNGETLFNAVGMAFPAADDNYFSVTMDTIVSIPCNCCYTFGVKNIGANEVTVSNANLIFERIC